MTNEERDIIARFIARIAGAESGGFAGSVPATAPALPPVDPEADALIAELFARYPAARYRITQTAFVQEHALAEAQNRIRQLQADLDQARQLLAAAPPASPQAAPRPSGFFGGLFGGGAQAAAPGAQPGPQPAYAPPPQYPPNYQPGMFQRQGSGFLGSALTTAAGVAGGMVVGNALMDLLSPRHAEAGGFGMMEPAASPWSAGPMGAPGAAAAPNPWDNAANQADSSPAWDAAQNDAAPGADNDAAGGWSDAAAMPDDTSPDDTSFDDTSFDDI